MPSGRRRRSIAFFIVLGACLIAGVLALNIGWVIVNWRAAGMLIFGFLAFPLIITGVVLNTTFLVREIRRNEQHDAFINAVTHELKTPVASIRLYLQTLQSRPIDDSTRQGFYQVMIEDTDRLAGTIDQVLRAARVGAKLRRARPVPVDLSAMVRDCLALARTRPSPAGRGADLPRVAGRGSGAVLGDEEDLKAVVSNLVDNAVKYSGSQVQVAVELDQGRSGARHAARARSGRRHLRQRAQADLQTLLPDSRRGRDAGEGYRSWGCSSSEV
jgi:signal transduction histidine kinase